MNTTPTHISLIRAGDTVTVNGQTKTVCRADLKTGFMGLTLWGDSYKLGAIPVQRVNMDQGKK